MNNVLIDYLVIAVYTVVVIGIGFLFSREKKDSETYLLGGRSMPAWAIGIACMMSLFSSVSIVMYPGEIYNYGMTYFLSSLITPFLAIPCYMLFARFYFRLKCFTPYEYLEYRYDRTVRGVVAVASFYTKVIYIGMVLYTSAKIFEGAFHWAPWFSILLVAVIGIGCCFIGGSKAVVWTDVFQAIITFGGLLAVCAILCWKIKGGFIGAVSVAIADGHGMPQFGQKEFYSLSPYVRLLFWTMLYGSIANCLTNACSNQVAIQRYLSCKDWKEGLKSQLISIVSGLAFTFILFFTGLALYTYYKQNPTAEIGAKNGDIALFHFVREFMPSPLTGLFIAAMLAAIMSTVSGATNSMAGVYLKEFHSRFFNKNMTDADEFRVLRWATIIIGAFSVLLALGLEWAGNWLKQSVAEVGTIFNLLGAVILPAFLCAVLSRRANAKLVWAATFFSIGETVVFNVWYALSRAAEQAYAGDPSVGFGWAGKLDFKYVWPFILLPVIFLIPWFFAGLRNKLIVKLSALLSATFLGGAFGMLFWYLFSNMLITDTPLARSFSFGLPIPLIMALIVLKFCPVQPKEKWQGLTLDTMDQETLLEK